ncbi:MAG TPA: cell division protein ZipA C-terminal FtsZ-binding domain-containing protein [Burkholderiales bacterium]|nr:cell division protein ZipA C-terminal FtsZ-binding domain-containing protein [Burkholderiales bacterium]
MGELQFGLIAIGTLVVAGVFFYNKWQERRYQRRAEAAFGSRHEDVLMRSGTGEGQGGERPASDRIEPVLSSLGTAPGPGRSSRQVLTEFVDFIVPIESPEEVSGASMLDAAGAAFDRCPRSVHLEGYDEALASWELVDPDRSYSRMRVGLQLVDRRGAADADELAAFATVVEGAATSLGMLAAVPDPAQALARAKELDRFCSELDIRIAVHLANDNTPFAGTRVDAAAKAAGFELDEPDGKFRRKDANGAVICVLENSEPIPFKLDSLDTLSTHAVTLEIDVPRAPPGAFARFREAAERIGKQLNARIVDDNRQPVTAVAFDAIGTQLQAVHTALEARGIAPGGALALRLFS